MQETFTAGMRGSGARTHPAKKADITRSPDPIAGERGLDAPSPRILPPLSVFQASEFSPSALTVSPFGSFSQHPKPSFHLWLTTMLNACRLNVNLQEVMYCFKISVLTRRVCRMAWDGHGPSQNISWPHCPLNIRKSCKRQNGLRI